MVDKASFARGLRAGVSLAIGLEAIRFLMQGHSPAEYAVHQQVMATVVALTFTPAGLWMVARTRYRLGQ